VGRIRISPEELEHSKNKIRKIARNWLIRHPGLNPYKVDWSTVYRISTFFVRPVLPDFLIIGAAKSGTTSLYSNLIKHPQIFSAMRKELDFFNQRYHYGNLLYRSFYPTIFTKFYQNYIKKNKMITGEASAGYLPNLYTARRIHELIPEIKLIVILRNPVDRAYSGYNHNFHVGGETLSFEVALNKERERTDEGEKKMLANEKYYSSERFRYGYCYAGQYSVHLKNWFKLFSKKQFLILDFNQLKTEPQGLLNNVFEFLEASKFKVKNQSALNVTKYSKMNSVTREKLINYYKPYNQELFNLIDMKFDWDH